MEATLTLSRESGPHITCVICPVDKKGWELREAVDEDGNPAEITQEELESLQARADAGEDETGR